MRWYDDPILIVGMGVIGVCLILAATVGVCLILLWYRRRSQAYAYDRLPINWGEPLIQERTVPDVVVDLDVAQIQNDLLSALGERDALRHELADAQTRLVSSERARKRHLATVRRLQRGGEGRDPRVPSHVPELWTVDHGSGRGQAIRP